MPKIMIAINFHPTIYDENSLIDFLFIQNLSLVKSETITTTSRANTHTMSNRVRWRRFGSSGLLYCRFYVQRFTIRIILYVTWIGSRSLKSNKFLKRCQQLLRRSGQRTTFESIVCSRVDALVSQWKVRITRRSEGDETHCNLFSLNAPLLRAPSINNPQSFASRHCDDVCHFVSVLS